MGLLDDAIREHLELKRRHGTDENEVSRLETEAFGASVPAPPPADAPEPAPADTEPPHGDPLEEAVEPEAPAATLPPAEAPAATPPPADAPPAAPPPADTSAAFIAEEPWLDEPDEVPHGERLDHPRAQATTEFTPDDHAAAVGEAGYVAPDEEPAEDLLEETPEFLQETPEHDRLWFEQKPPRDFDFGN